MNLDPLLGNPIEDVDGIEALLIWASPSKNNDPVIFRIIAHSAIRTLGRDVSTRLDLCPLHCRRVK